MADESIETILHGLKEDLKKPETIHRAVTQYIVTQLAAKLVLDSGSDTQTDVSISTSATGHSETGNDDGTTVACHDEVTTVLGVQVWSTHVCDTVATSTTQPTISYQF